MTLQETLNELLAQEVTFADVPSILWDRADVLHQLVKTGHIQESSACSRLRTIYQELIDVFHDYDAANRADWELYGDRYIPKPGKAALSRPRSIHQSGYTGVSWNTRKGLWIVNYTLNGRTLYLGERHDVDDAIKLRQAAEKKYGAPKIGRPTKR